ncbi:hypothetical protein Hanom_Chr01g00028161 [Helianthus anomalus]
MNRTFNKQFVNRSVNLANKHEQRSHSFDRVRELSIICSITFVHVRSIILKKKNNKPFI